MALMEAYKIEPGGRRSSRSAIPNGYQRRLRQVHPHGGGPDRKVTRQVVCSASSPTTAISITRPFAGCAGICSRRSTRFTCFDLHGNAKKKESQPRRFSPTRMSSIFIKAWRLIIAVRNALRNRGTVSRKVASGKNVGKPRTAKNNALWAASLSDREFSMRLPEDAPWNYQAAFRGGDRTISAGLFDR